MSHEPLAPRENCDVMVDFKKWLAKRDVWKRIDPVAIYETLDRASDKGPLRPPPRQRSFGPGTSSAETRSGRAVSERDGRSDQPRERRGTIPGIAKMIIAPDL